MNIGIDIDGVITNVEQYMLSYCSKFCHENGIISTEGDKKDYSPQKMYNLTEEQNDALWKSIVKVYPKTVTPRMYAVEVIKKLKEKHNIHIITARTFEKEFYDTIEKQKEGQQETIEWFKKYNIPFDTITFTLDKAKVVKQKNIDLMIEDNADNIKMVEPYCDVLVFNALYNENVDKKRVYSWYEILEIIENYVK